jgi:hypothetical protein
MTSRLGTGNSRAFFYGVETSSIIFDAVKDSTIRGVATSVAGLHHVDADADADPDPTYHFDADADPDPDFYLMRIRMCIRIQIFI